MTLLFNLMLTADNPAVNVYGDFYKPRKARFIPTFCKRINRTSNSSRQMVTAFEERKTNDLYMQQNLYTTTTINRVLHQME